jgi:putative ABC transport system substrate-binding protein
MRRDKFVSLAAQHAVPTMYQFREFAEAGGLVSYGIDFSEVYRQVGVYVGRILKGARPGDLPVMQGFQIRVSDQPQDRQGAWPHHSAVAAAAGGSSD